MRGVDARGQVEDRDRGENGEKARDREGGEEREREREQLLGSNR